MGTWTSLTNQPSFSAGTMLLLTDGSVICQNSGTPHWQKLTPDDHGSYINGNWSALSDAPNAPLYFASAVLPNGRVFVAGGEYEDGLNWDLLAAQVYNPQSDLWSIASLPQAGPTSAMPLLACFPMAAYWSALSTPAEPPSTIRPTTLGWMPQLNSTQAAVRKPGRSSRTRQS